MVRCANIARGPAGIHSEKHGPPSHVQACGKLARAQFRGAHMHIFLIAILAISLSTVAAAKDKKKPADSQEPVVFGILSQNVGCVIFREYRKTSGMFWGVAVTTKTVGKLEVIETQNYALDR